MDKGFQETHDEYATLSRIFDCVKCGDGDALRQDESCAYCGLDRGEEQ